MVSTRMEMLIALTSPHFTFDASRVDLGMWMSSMPNSPQPSPSYALSLVRYNQLEVLSTNYMWSRNISGQSFLICGREMRVVDSPKYEARRVSRLPIKYISFNRISKSQPFLLGEQHFKFL